MILRYALILRHCCYLFRLISLQSLLTNCLKRLTPRASKEQPHEVFGFQWNCKNRLFLGIFNYFCKLFLHIILWMVGKNCWIHMVLKIILLFTIQEYNQLVPSSSSELVYYYSKDSERELSEFQMNECNTEIPLNLKIKNI